MASIDWTDPIAGFRFSVEIEGIVVGWFTECSGLSIERTVVPYEEGGVNEYVHQLPGPNKHANITLKRGLSDESLWTWFRDGLYDGQVRRANASVILYHTDRTEARRWNLTNAYPVKWVGPDLKAGDQQVAVETLEIAQGIGGSGAAAGESVSTIQTWSIGQEANLVDDNEQSGLVSERPDLTALAAKVYDLLKQDLRLERERTNRTW